MSNKNTYEKKRFQNTKNIASDHGRKKRQDLKLSGGRRRPIRMRGVR